MDTSKHFIIGLDLSTTITGISVMTNDKQLLMCGELKLRDNDWNYEYDLVLTKFQKAFESIFEKTKGKYYKVGIELGNFSNAKLTQEFSFFCGMLFALMEHYSRKYNYNYEFKTYNANEWMLHLLQRLGVDITKLTRLTREERKAMSIQSFYENHKYYKIEEITDNMSDSYWIAYYFDNCKSTKDRKILTSDRDRKLAQIRKLKKEIKFYEKQLKSASNPNNLKLKIERRNKKLKELQEND